MTVAEFNALLSGVKQPELRAALADRRSIAEACGLLDIGSARKTKCKGCEKTITGDARIQDWCLACCVKEAAATCVATCDPRDLLPAFHPLARRL